MYGLRGIGKKIPTAADNGITIFLYGDYTSSEVLRASQPDGASSLPKDSPGPNEANTLYLEMQDYDREFLAEDLCKIAASKLDVGTLGFPLFALYDLKETTWLSPSSRILCSKVDSRQLVLRIRCLPPPRNIVTILFTYDPGAFKYLFLQLRHDFLNSLINYSKDQQIGREHHLGLVVMDLVRYGKERGLQVKQIEALDPKHFLPVHSKDMYNFLWDKHRLRKNIKPELQKQYEKYKAFQPVKVMLNFILGLHKYMENYGIEKFQLRGQQVVVDPYRSFKPGVYSITTIENQKDETWFCRLEDLISVTMTRVDSTLTSVVLNRRSGMPVDYRFQSEMEAVSFISLLDAYHRMLEDYHHNLCPMAVKSPVLDELRKIGCHGPVSKKWAQDRLKQRNNTDVVFNYLLKQKSSDYTTLILFYINGLQQQVVFYEICQVHGGKWQLGMINEPLFDDLQMLLVHYKSGKCPKINLKRCVRPSAPLDKRLYLCKDDTGTETTLPVSPRQQRAAVSLVSGIQTTSKKLLGQGHFTEVYLGEWDRDSPPNVNTASQIVAIKQLQRKYSSSNLQDFTRSLHKVAFWSHATIVTIHALCLAPNFCCLMEAGQLGTLESYLRQPETGLTIYSLLMVAEQLAQALLYLETREEPGFTGEKGACHGNIRSRNVLVFDHDEDSKMLRVKLGDPGMIYSYNRRDLKDPIIKERLPWIAPELYSNDSQQLLDRMTFYSDRYAYGMTLWEILSQGEQPFTYMRTSEEIKRFVLDGHMLKKPNKDCPDDMYMLMTRCWRRRPEDRASAKEIVRDICNLIQSDYRAQQEYEQPKWTKTSKTSGSTKKTAASTIPSNQAGSHAAHEGPYNVTSRHSSLATTAPPLATMVTMNPSGSVTPGGDSDPTGSGGWAGVPARGLSSPSGTSTGSFDSTTPLVSQGAQSASLADSVIGDSVMGSAMSGLTTTTDVGGSREQLDDQREDDQERQWQQQSPESRSMLKRPLPKTPDMPQPIEPLPHEDLQFDITKNKLGEGHYGEVYKGYFTTNHGNPRPVAIKRLKPDMYNKYAEEFEKEFKIMIPLKHPRIVEIIGMCPQNDENNMLLVMEFVDKGALKMYLKKQSRALSIPTLLTFCLEIAEGMDYLSEKKIFHRDLAARNVLVTRYHHMKITDFGLARAIEGDKTYYKMNSSKEFPAYWYAPEAIETNRYNVMSDVWSFGVTAWEIFHHGDDPDYNLDDLSKLIYKLRQGKRLTCSSLPDDICDLMNCCWEYEPSKRKTFAQLQQVISALLKTHAPRV